MSTGDIPPRPSKSSIILYNERKWPIIIRIHGSSYIVIIINIVVYIAIFGARSVITWPLGFVANIAWSSITYPISVTVYTGWMSNQAISNFVVFLTSLEMLLCLLSKHRLRVDPVWVKCFFFLNFDWRFYKILYRRYRSRHATYVWPSGPIVSLIYIWSVSGGNLLIESFSTLISV